MFMDGEVDWSCKYYCCDDWDECNCYLYVLICNVYSVYGF